MNLRRSLVAASLLLAALAGCSDVPQPTLTAGRAPSRAVDSSVSIVGVLQFIGMPNLSGTRHAEALIDAQTGGSLSLNGFRVTIPAGALPNDTVVTIDLPTDNVLGKRLLAEFGPHGVQFNTPVTITFPLTGVNLSGSPIEVARWENGAWTSLGGSVNTLGTELSSTTPHFSTYGGKYVLAGG